MSNHAKTEIQDGVNSHPIVNSNLEGKSASLDIDRLYVFDPESMSVEEYRRDVLDILCGGVGIEELTRMLLHLPHSDCVYEEGRLDDFFTLYGVTCIDDVEVYDALITLQCLYCVLVEVLDGTRLPLGTVTQS